jgi:hypothetical protein
MRLIQSVIFSLLICINVNAQPTIKILEFGKRISIRGLSVVNDNIIWASGSGGSVARSTDGGNTFNWIKVPGYEKNDFRDIEAFDSNTAIIMGITTPAVILKTKDGGKNWKKVFEDTTKEAFFDAMDFVDSEHGTLVGDPIGDYMFIAETFDGGESWRTLSRLDKIPMSANGEAFFASSGTNLKLIKSGGIFMATGGKESNLYSFNDITDQPIPIMKGGTSTGANSIDYFNAKRKGIIVGGDFAKDTIAKNNCALFSYKSGKFSFTIPQTPPHGYRSCVIYLDEKYLLTCGTSGIDISKDGGMNWELISKESFHVCQKAKKGKAVFLAGSNGRIAKLVN